MERLHCEPDDCEPQVSCAALMLSRDASNGRVSLVLITSLFVYYTLWTLGTVSCAQLTHKLALFSQASLRFSLSLRKGKLSFQRFLRDTMPC